MNKFEKLEKAIRRSIPLLPPEAQQQVREMLSLSSLIIISGTLTVWAGSHLIGVGEIIDLILLLAGSAVLGASFGRGAIELQNFAITAIRAQNDSDIDRAAQHFAKAVNILGISIVSALLLRRSAKVGKLSPKVKEGLPNVGPRLAGGKPTIKGSYSLPSRILGETDSWGNITINLNKSADKQQLALYHELVHRFFSPRFGRLRAQLAASGYERSALLRYVEEAMAECYARARFYGLDLNEILMGIRFPIKNDYITVSQLVTEGTAIGNITIGGALFIVRVINRNQE